LDNTFDEIKNLEIEISNDDLDFDNPSDALVSVHDEIIDLFTERISPHLNTIKKIKYPLNPGIRKCIYKLILFDNDHDVSPNKKLVIMFAFYNPYFSNLKTLDSHTVKSEYKKSLKRKIITLDFTRAAAMMYEPFDEVADHKRIITKWLGSDTKMNTSDTKMDTVDGGRNRKKRNSRKKHKSVKTLKRRPKSKKAKQV
jgi:hypothetical protein